jgi:hypothetical protein
MCENARVEPTHTLNTLTNTHPRIFRTPCFPFSPPSLLYTHVVSRGVTNERRDRPRPPAPAAAPADPIACPVASGGRPDP